MCDCQSKRVSGTNNSRTSSEVLFRVSSFLFDICNTLFFSEAFLKRAVITICSPRSETAVSVVASRQEDEFIDLIANSILGVTILSMAVKNVSWFLFSTVSTILLISLSILSLNYISKAFTFSGFSLVTKILLLLQVPMVISRSTVPSLATVFSCLSLAALPIMIS